MNIFDFTHEKLKRYLLDMGEKSYRADQIFKQLYQGRAVSDMTDLPKNLRETMTEQFSHTLPEIEKKLVSVLDGTVKYLFRMSDAALVEGVVMRYRHGISMCVSSQVGCAMGCAFCASAVGGLERNLTAGEISGQIMSAEKDLGERISNIVMMGSGEPFDNLENVMDFIKNATHPDGLAVGARHITVSTCGIKEGIERLADSGIPVNLSLSLHAPTDEMRRKMMPAASKIQLSELIACCRGYFERTRRRVTYEYALIKDLNDSEDTAEKLAALLKGAGAHVNIIPVNSVRGKSFSKSERVGAFKKTLENNGINATVRREMGADINAACGQLRNRNLKGRCGDD